jgi:hypothetical protein
VIDATVAPRLTQLRVRLAIVGDAVPPPTPSNETFVGVPFDFSTPSQIFLTYAIGTTFNLAGVTIETAFNAPATLRLGSSADLSMLLGATDSRLTVVGQYQSDAIVVANAPDVLMLTMNTAGASTGSGYIFYRSLT